MEFQVLFVVVIVTVAIATIVYLRLQNLKTTVNEYIKEPVILKVSVPFHNEKKAQAAEQLLQALHGILKSGEKSKSLFSFEIVGNTTGIYFILVCEQRYRNFIETQVYAWYPDAQISQIKDYSLRTVNQGEYIDGFELEMKRDYSLPIKTYSSFEVDPLASITAAFSRLEAHTEVYVQVLARPISDEWQKKGKEFVNTMKSRTDEEGKRIGLESGEGDEIRQVEYKNSKSGFNSIIRLMVRSGDKSHGAEILEDAHASFNQFQTTQFNGLRIRKVKLTLSDKLKQLILGKRLGEKIELLKKYQLRYLNEFETTIFNTEELASVYHFPNASVETPNIAWARSRKLEPPIDLPTNHARLFGVTDYRNQHVKFGIKKEDRRRHMYLLGKTGTGKSLFIKNMVFGDLKEGEGFCVVDPHGELIEDILEFIPQERMKDVVYLDPSDMENPIGLNMLDLMEGESKELLADGIVSVFIKLFGHSWGPRLQYLLTNTILTLLHCQNVSLLAVQRILIDKNYRKFLLKQVNDPFLLKFWEEEYEQMSKNQKLITEAISPIQNKVGRFLGSPLVRNMIGQVKSSIDLREIMDDGKILLINLSQGKIGEENTALLGGMLITRLYTNAMQRASVSSDKRRDFYLYVDEFQNFATDTFVKILSESRKYGLNLLVTHQFIDQIQENIQDAIFGNVGTLINYVVGPKDAARLEREYKPDLTVSDLVNLEKFSFATKLMIDGAQSKPFTGKLLLPNYAPTGLKEEIKDMSRKTYGSKRAEVEFKLNKWANQKYDDKGNLMQTNSK